MVAKYVITIVIKIIYGILFQPNFEISNEI
jgi:hypothetical protein